MKFPFPASRLRAAMESMKPETAFLVLACSFGLAVLAANPPFQAPDENDHFFRVFQISEGTFIGERHGATAGGDLPQAAVDVTNTEGIPFHYEKKMTRGLFTRLAHPVFLDWSRAPRGYHAFPHTVVYAPACYLPQAVAVFAGRHLRVGPLGLMYLARLAGFAACVALGYAALRVLPIYRWTVLVILLCPMSLYLFGSVASDGLLVTGAALLVAWLVRLVAEGGREARLGEQAGIVALLGLLAVAKPVYVPLAGVALFVVIPGLGSLRGRALFGAAVAAACLLPVWLWGRVAVSLFVPGKEGVPLDPVAQAHHIAQGPVEFILLVAQTLHVQYSNNFRWMVGTLGWGDTPMPAWFYPAFAYGVLACLVMESDGGRILGWRLRGVIAMAAAASVLLIYAAQYASWNPPGSTSPIEGIEGRYFLPLLPLAVLSFPAFPVRLPRVLVAALAGALSVVCAAVCLWSVIVRYYVTPAPPAPSAKTVRLVNVSARAFVGARENVLVTGFSVGGPGLETLLIRAEGPSLARLGLAGVLARPSLRVVDAEGTVLAANTRWGANPDPARILRASAAVGAYALPQDSADCALILSVPRGRYTAVVSGENGSTGIVLQDIYELSSSGTRLENFSSRGYVGRGANIMVVGFAVRGRGAESVLGRADGPSLAQFGITGVLAAPALEMGPFPSGSLSNAGWGTRPDTAEISAAASRVGAFSLAAGSGDSAALATVEPGAYTMKVSGVGGATGVALAEIYELP